MVNVSIHLKVEVQSSLLFFHLTPGDNSTTEKNNMRIKTNVNLCKMPKSFAGNFVAKILLQNLRQYTDFELKCPLKKVKINFRKNSTLNPILGKLPHHQLSSEYSRRSSLLCERKLQISIGGENSRQNTQNTELF